MVRSSALQWEPIVCGSGSPNKPHFLSSGKPEKLIQFCCSPDWFCLFWCWCYGCCCYCCQMGKEGRILETGADIPEHGCLRCFMWKCFELVNVFLVFKVLLNYFRILLLISPWTSLCICVLPLTHSSSPFLSSFWFFLLFFKLPSQLYSKITFFANIHHLFV